MAHAGCNCRVRYWWNNILHKRQLLVKCGGSVVKQVFQTQQWKLFLKIEIYFYFIFCRLDKSNVRRHDRDLQQQLLWVNDSSLSFLFYLTSHKIGLIHINHWPILTRCRNSNTLQQCHAAAMLTRRRLMLTHWQGGLASSGLCEFLLTQAIAFFLPWSWC